MITDQEKKNKNFIKELSRLFSARIAEDNDIIPEADRVGYMDAANVCMLVPKRYGIKSAMISLFDVIETKVPKLVYDDKKALGAKYSSEYLNIILQLTKQYTAIKLTTAQDFPLTAECDDFILILAPRVDND